VLGEHPEQLGRRGGGQFADEGSVAAPGQEAVADAAHAERGKADQRQVWPGEGGAQAFDRSTASGGKGWSSSSRSLT
jgi:hypothetical protein